MSTVRRMRSSLGMLAASISQTAMHPIPHNPPQISTMPRQQTEASILLDLHKLVSEKNRLQQELITLEARQALIRDRLNQIETDRAILEENRSAIRTRSIAPALPSALSTPSSYDITFLEY
ncbi:hypothetical protein H6F67_00995 [Microcoleus sp. FACHB-1515]|uniref:hypothetical protein n=1 Tax=Cyanophyceae TaxID=3028117 RepID=UPI0016822D46|nr:hypothetical protein [Microcoleus sp. FACHB-1515]MBD2088448.1 hypothetical protein [Microcoleus sp. FACHB-1515]